jgi:hypothetical protein
MLTNSRWPPRSHMENVIVVLRTEMVFSIKLTPGQRDQATRKRGRQREILTQRLNVILIKTSLHILDHETRFANLRVPDHSDLYHDARDGQRRKGQMNERKWTNLFFSSLLLPLLLFGSGCAFWLLGPATEEGGGVEDEDVG